MSKLCFAALAVLGIGLCGCQEKRQTTTRGNISILVGESVLPVVQKEAAEFERLYEQAHIDIVPTTSREAIVQFLTGKVTTIVISRSLNEEEKRVVEAYKLTPHSWPFAMDAVVIIVHPANPISRMTYAQIGEVFSGRVRSWQKLGAGRGEIEPFVLSRNAGTAEYLLRTVIGDTVFTASAQRCSTSAQLVELVASRRQAVGFVGLAWANEKVKALEIAADSAATYVPPYQGFIYRGDYPLRRAIYVMSSDVGYAGLATGFITFLTSAQGQKIVTNSGLVPVTMPVKLVKIQ